jgi:hypothetical protein
MALPTPQEVFSQQTGLYADIIADIIISNRRTAFTQEKKDWFIDMADKRTRWLYANDSKWAKELKLNPKHKFPGNIGRDYLRMFINHWLDAYEKDIEKYQREHPMELFRGA